MFSGLSKLADKSFVLGFFLPSLVGSLAFIALNRDLAPFNALVDNALHEKTFANLTMMLLAVWTLSVLLMAGSHWMYRVLEGYAWPLNHPALRARQIARRKRQRVAVREADAAMSEAQEALGATSDHTVRGERRRMLDERRLEYLRRCRSMALDYPAQRELVLPTRFGNALRAFEMYAGQVYGVESIHAWPRLLAVVPKDYQTTLADTRAPVDFFVSLVFVAFGLGIVALARGCAAILVSPNAAASWLFWVSAVVAFIVVRLAYLAALSSAVAWGEVVKSAFDLYLPALARAMGYELPATAAERRRFWEAQANQFQFHEPVAPEDWKSADASAPAAAHSSKDASGLVEESGAATEPEEDEGSNDPTDRDEGEKAPRCLTNETSVGVASAK